jgi:hypothetical protein
MGVRANQLSLRAKALAGQLSGLDMKAHKQAKGHIQETLSGALDAAFGREC